MSSSVCQGFQSCLEPPVLEPRVLKLRLTPSKSNFSGTDSKLPFDSYLGTQQKSQNELNKLVKCKEAEMGGWSFLQCLSCKSESNKNDVAETEQVYVHPLVKRSSSMLSKQSLEMCTESLGSETGGVVSDSHYNDSCLVSVESERFELPTRQNSKQSEIWGAKRLNRSRSFPPPLTSISGSSGVQVRPRRESGRLVLEAVAVSSPRPYFQAERSEGRLRLRLFNDNDDEEEEAEAEEEAEEEDEEAEEVEVEEVGMCFETEERVADEDEDEVYEEEIGEMGEEMDGISGNVGGEMGTRKLSRPSRCKEGGHGGNRGLINWETFWVST